jgi:mannose-6-phosphate isomerase-like protein (cupin superfamily)
MNVQSKAREFMTTWHTSARSYLPAWAQRNKASLMNSGKSTRALPMFRAFDLLAKPNDRIELLVNSDHRIGVESVCGAQQDFARHVDFDTVYMQFSGETVIETEFAEYKMVPGDIMHVPEGIAHRSAGSADSLRWFALVNSPFTTFMSEDDQVSETKFTVRRVGGPQWSIPADRMSAPRDRVVERMICWNDKPDDLTIFERDYADLVPAGSTSPREAKSGVTKLRAFDLFKEIAGTSGEPKPVMRGKHLEIKVYNIVGEQFAFHRALRSEEVRIQFRGNALDMSETGNADTAPGTVTMIPRGIGHSVITDPVDCTEFLRMNFYSELPWSVPHDVTKHYFDSHFEIETHIVQKAPWRA